MSVRYLSEVTCRVRGMRGYEYVKDEKGNIPSVGELKLAAIPRHVTDSRRREAVQASDDAIHGKDEGLQVEMETLNRQAGSTVVTPMTGNELNESRGWKATKKWGASAS